jgi:hypothetical protein
MATAAEMGVALDAKRQATKVWLDQFRTDDGGFKEANQFLTELQTREADLDKDQKAFDAQTSLEDVAGQVRVAVYPDSEGRSAGGSIGLDVVLTGVADLAAWNVWVTSSAPSVCDGEARTFCHRVDDNGAVHLRATVDAGGATLDGSPAGSSLSVDATGPTTLELSFGGQTFVPSESVAPVSIDLASTAPSWCEVD